MSEKLWCLYHNKGNPSQDDKVTAEVLRCLICDSSYGSSNLRNEGGSEDLLDSYGTLMSSSIQDGGINNYAESVLPLIANQRNDSDNWTSQLDFSSVISKLVCQSPSADAESIIIPSASKENIQTDVSQIEGTSQIIASQQTLPIAQAPSAAGTTFLRRDTAESMPTCTSEVPIHDSFRTAKEQLIVNQMNNNKSGPSTAYNGQAKKSLGPRRAAGKFVSPLQQDLSSNSNAGQSREVNPVSKSRTEPVVYDEDLELPEQLSHLDPNIVKLIMSEIMDTSAQVSWTDIAGLQFAKKTLKEIIILPMLRPDIFTGLRGPPKGLLLFGPPGTGKTLIGKCVASQSKCTFFSISASSLTSKWVGEGEKMVRALFAVARYKQPAVVFIDEIDSLLTQRSESEHESSRRIKTEFLVQMDGVGCDGDDRILVIGATNRPQELDEAARRRFVKRLYIPLPESAARLAIIRHHMQRQHVQMGEGDLESIVSSTAGYSGADMTNLCKEAALGPVRDIHFEDIETIQLDQVRPINVSDFMAALKQVRASVDPTDLDSYLAWNSKFGSWAIKNTES